MPVGEDAGGSAGEPQRVANWGLAADAVAPAPAADASPVLALPPGFMSNPLAASASPPSTPPLPSSPAMPPPPTPNSAKKVHPTAWADDDSDGDSLPDLPEEWITSTSLSVSASTPMLGASTRRSAGSTIDDDACSSVSESVTTSERPARRKGKRGGVAKRKGRASSGEAALAAAPARGASSRDGARAASGAAASHGPDMGLRIAGRAAQTSSQHSSASPAPPPSAPSSMRRASAAPSTPREPASQRDGSRLRASGAPRGARAEPAPRARPSQVRDAPPHDGRAAPPASAPRGPRASAPPTSAAQAPAAPRARPHGRPKLAGDAVFARLAGAALSPGDSLGAPAAANGRGGRRFRAASEAPAA